ncbi:hypothetical protein ACIQ7D_14220 [Streptomyces sp. NPDC096310]|uniref:hypothetical protein n=1 Tax=Streptomyces sp. NPDC096310 TaxID=3366082 RepID=UPI0037F66C8C
MHAPTASTVPAQVCDTLATLADGPVVCHPGIWFYALVPAGTTETWRSPDAVVLGRGVWLGVPRLDSTLPVPPLPYWAVPRGRPASFVRRRWWPICSGRGWLG